MSLSSIVGAWSKISGERSPSEVSYITSTFHQHQKEYQFVRSKAKAKTVLDVGCGSGEGDYLLSMVASKVVAIDKDAAAIQNASLKYKNINMSFKKIDLKDFTTSSKFDLVISFQLIEHLKDVDVFLKKIQKLVSNRGTVIISTPNRLTQGYNENPFHVREYSQPELRAVLIEYFSSVTILGLFGDSNVAKYEAQRKIKILRLFSFDLFQARRLIPRQIKIAAFSFLAFFVRKDIPSQNISSSSYKIKKYERNCIDLIAICQK